MGDGTEPLQCCEADEAMDEAEEVSEAWLCMEVLDEPSAVDTIDEADWLRCSVIASGEPDDTPLDARLSRRWPTAADEEADEAEEEVDEVERAECGEGGEPLTAAS